MQRTSVEPNKRPRRRGLVLLLVVIILLAIGTRVAIALWPASANGNGNAKAVTAQLLTVTAAATPSADLWPGASGALQFTVANPNPYPVSLTSIDYGAISSSDQADCPAANVTTAADGLLAAPIGVTADSSSTDVSIANAITLASNAPTGCQGVTFTIAVALSGSQT